MKTVVFERSVREFVLDVFDKRVDDDGYIVERGDDSKVMTPSGEHLKIEDFAGVTPGSEIFLTKDLPSLLKYANREANRERVVAE